ncbi:hypothetical protein C0J52_26689 [Blattella germanica]|nr:hypothetical protein C0J52_26689 [Blattella germanica]
MSMCLHSLLTFRNFTTGLELPCLWLAVTCWSVYGESWITALISVVSPSVHILSTCKVCNKTWRVLHFRAKIFDIRWVG